MTGIKLIEALKSANAEKLFLSLYGKEGLYQARERYHCLIEELLNDSIFPLQDFPEVTGDIRLFSVPGRTELGGNHTDHNRGKVLAASIQLDAAAVAAPRSDSMVFFRSRGHSDVKVDISDLSPRSEERGHAKALVRGIAAEFNARGAQVGGFTANADNLVLPGSGLSSSAAVEVLIAKIFDNLFCGGKRSPLELAQIGQKAENVYFGKPCGLMDQIACASGGAVAVDFKDLQNPLIKRISFDPAAAGFALCIVNTKGSHSDLAPEYAAIPQEMKAAASFFGKTELRELDEKTMLGRLADLRNSEGDRAVLRALHFFGENRRVEAMLAGLEKMSTLPVNKKGKEMESFLALVKESGDSSWELLQNVYCVKNPKEQGLSLALAVTGDFLNGSGTCLSEHKDACSGRRPGAWRVHGGGFAGTIQAYLPLDVLDDYRNLMEGIFGKGALTVLWIRPLGALELDL